MKQGKVLTDAEMKRLLAVVANGRHAERNRLAVMLSQWSQRPVTPLRPELLELVSNGGYDAQLHTQTYRPHT